MRNTKTFSLFIAAAALLGSCTFLALDDVDARSCGGGTALEQNRKCAHLNANAATRSADACRTWQCLGPDNRRRCALALRDDDADRVPAAICAADLPEVQRDCNDSADATNDAGMSGNDNFPGNVETCDGKDQDCDGLVDDGLDFSRRLTSQNVTASSSSLPNFMTTGGKVIALQRNTTNGSVILSSFQLTEPASAPEVPTVASLSVVDSAGDDRLMAAGASPMGDRWLFAATQVGSTELSFSWGIGRATPQSIRFAGTSEAGISDAALDASRDGGTTDGGSGTTVAKAVSIAGANACGSRTFALSAVQRSSSGASCDSGSVRFRAMRVPTAPGATFAANFGEASGPSTSDRAGVQILSISSPETATLSKFLTFVATASGIEVGLLETSDASCTANTGSLSYTRVDTLSGTNPFDVSAAWAGMSGSDSRVVLAFRNGDCTAGDTVSVRILRWNDTARTITAARMDDFAANGARSVGVAWLDTLSEAVVAWYSQAGGTFAVRGRRVSEMAGAIDGEFAFAPTDAAATVPSSGAGRLFLVGLGDHIDGFLLAQVNAVPTFVRLSVAVAACGN